MPRVCRAFLWLDVLETGADRKVKRAAGLSIFAIQIMSILQSHWADGEIDADTETESVAGI